MVKPPACANVFATYRVRSSVCTNALPVRALSGDWVGAYAGFTLADKMRMYRARVARVRPLVALAACGSFFFDQFQLWFSSVRAVSHGRSQRTRWVSMWGLVLAKKPSLRNALHRFSSLCALCACISRGASWGASCQGMRIRFSYSQLPRQHAS